MAPVSFWNVLITFWVCLCFLAQWNISASSCTFPDPDLQLHLFKKQVRPSHPLLRIFQWLQRIKSCSFEALLYFSGLNLWHFPFAHLHPGDMCILTVPRTCPTIVTSGPLHGWLSFTLQLSLCTTSSEPQKGCLLYLKELPHLTHPSLALSVISVVFALKHTYIKTLSLLLALGNED